MWEAMVAQDELDYNLEIANSSDLYPPVDVKVMCKFTFGSTHCTIAFRCWKHSMWCSVAQSKWAIPSDDDDLKYLANFGHSYYLYDEDRNQIEYDMRYLRNCVVGLC